MGAGRDPKQGPVGEEEEERMYFGHSGPHHGGRPGSQTGPGRRTARQEALEEEEKKKKCVDGDSESLGYEPKKGCQGPPSRIVDIEIQSQEEKKG